MPKSTTARTISSRPFGVRRAFLCVSIRSSANRWGLATSAFPVQTEWTTSWKFTANPPYSTRLPRRNPECRRPLEQEVCPGAARHPPDRKRAKNAGDGDEQRDRADVVDQSG